MVRELYYPYNLVVKVLFGCGLRLFEGLQLRVRDFNFDVNVLTVHGKGKKDRTVAENGDVIICMNPTYKGRSIMLSTRP